MSLNISSTLRYNVLYRDFYHDLEITCSAETLFIMRAIRFRTVAIRIMKLKT